jgi:hypothetical protein
MAATHVTTFEEVAQFLRTYHLTPEQREYLWNIINFQVGIPQDVHVPIKQGHFYAYQLPFVSVHVQHTDPLIQTQWSLVKVGRADPGNIQQRLCGERVMLQGNRQLFVPKPTIHTPETRPLEDLEFRQEVDRDWGIYTDLLFLFEGDIGREKEYRKWPTGVGIEVGTGCLNPIPPTLALHWYHRNSKIKATALRAWILGMCMNIRENGGVAVGDVTPESLGESEWVIIPTHLVQWGRTFRINSEYAFRMFLTEVHRTISPLLIQSVTLTIPGRIDHQSFTFQGSQVADWPGLKKRGK